MLFSTVYELDLVITILALIVYGLISLRNVSITLPDVTLFTCVSMLLLAPYVLTTDNTTPTHLINCLLTTDNTTPTHLINSLLSFEGMLAAIMVLVVIQVRSLEGIILLFLAYISQVYMLHSIDFLTFYVTLELQNFVFMVLCGLPKSSSNTGSESYTVEASLKFLVLSAFSSGVLLYWFSTLYQLTGVTGLLFRGVEYDMLNSTTQFIHSLILLAVVMFKLGAAPVHIWVVEVYGAVDRRLLFYINTAPKIALFGFWIGSFQGVWTEYSLLSFALLSLVLGALGAYNQSKVRMLLAYSTLNEIGLLLSAVETAGFTSLLQHLAVYITAQVLLWNLYDTRSLSLVAVSLGGLPPLAGFFGKSWIFWHIGTTGSYTLLTIALVFTVLSLVYYLRLLRLFYNVRTSNSTSYCMPYVITVGSTQQLVASYQMIGWACLSTVLLFVLPIMLVRPFVIA
jgi:NADH:ubiquinone oxidoreductase subunit 2 (subunit N)